MIRRTLLGAAVTTLIASRATGGSMTAPTPTGTITYGARKTLPAGRIALVIEDTADPAADQPTVLTVESDGTAETLDFTLPDDALSATLNRKGVELVAYLEREDGFLIARGSVEMPLVAPVVIDLATVMY